MLQDSGRLDLTDLGALERRIRDQTLLAEYKAHDGLLQGLAVVLTTGPCLGDGDPRVGSNVPSFDAPVPRWPVYRSSPRFRRRTPRS